MDTFIAIWEKGVVMQRVTLHVSGSVQRAGFRTKVVAIAKTLDIKGNVQNLPDGRVKIIAEAEDADLKKFIRAIDIKNAIINVTDIEKEYSSPTGEYEGFYKLVGEGETDERLDTAADLLKELIHVTKNGFDGLGNKIDGHGDALGNKIDGLGDALGNKIDQGREEITFEIRSMRDDFRSHIDKRLTKVELELSEIKAKVAMLH
jgi:acylphosphatase